MVQAPYLVGIDFGTGGVRVGIFDGEGTPLTFSGVEFDTAYPRPGMAEQDPDEWWEALVQAMGQAVREAGVPSEELAGISVDATSSTVVVLDDEGRQLRPAIMWMDVRSSEQARRIAESDDPALKYNGFGPVSAEWGLPKAMWLRDNEPETYQAAAHVCECVDWLIHRLTGEWVFSLDVASSKWYYDRAEGGFPETLYEAVGIDDLLGRFPPQVVSIGEVVGGLRREVAEELGLRPDIPVAEGGVDAHVGALGLGVVEPGKLALITGSSHVMIGQAARPIHSTGFWGAYTDALIPGQYTIEAGQAATGSMLAWFKRHFAGEAAGEAERRQIDTYEVLTEAAAEIPAGSDGLIVIDHFQGSRTPVSDPMARGMIWGLTLAHGPGHVFRALIEGVCYGTELILRSMRAEDFEPRLNVVSGVPTQNELWMQMHADVSNVPISLTKVSEGPVLGSAMLAAVGAGIYPDIPAAAEHMVHTERTIEPDPDRHEEYQFYVDKYEETYQAMQGLMRETVTHAEQARSSPASGGDSADEAGGEIG